MLLTSLTIASINTLLVAISRQHVRSLLALSGHGHWAENYNHSGHNHQKRPCSAASTAFTALYNYCCCNAYQDE
jgi:hypothetical protein